MCLCCHSYHVEIRLKNYTTNERERQATFSNTGITRAVGVINCVNICCSSVPESELGDYKQKLTALDYFERFCDQERYRALHTRLKSRYDGDDCGKTSKSDEQQQLIIA